MKEELQKQFDAGPRAQDVLLKLLTEDGPLEAMELRMRCYRYEISDTGLKKAKKRLQKSGQIIWEKVRIRSLGDRYYWRLTSQESVLHTLADRNAKQTAIREKAHKMVREAAQSGR